MRGKPAITDLQVKALVPDPAKPKGHKVKVKEGLFIFVTPKGSKSWRYSFRFAGKQQTLVIGTYPEVKVAAALARHRDAQVQLEKGTNPAVQKQLAGRDPGRYRL